MHRIVVFFSFLALAVFWTWPLAPNLPSRVAHDPGDPLLNTWILWWNAQAVPLTDSWWNAPFLFPMRRALALSEHLLGVSVFTTPMQLAGARPILAYNVAILLSYALSGFFAYLLAHRLTGSSFAAWCAGLAFAFAPYRAGQLAHLQVLTSQWMPLMLYGMHGYLQDRGSPFESLRSSLSPVEGSGLGTRGSGLRARWAALAVFGFAWLMQALSNGYFMLFLPALIVPWLAWFVDWRRDARRGVTLVGTWFAASVPLVPVLLGYRDLHESLGLARSLGDIRQFSATVGSFLHPPRLLAIWPEGSGATQEDFLFPGLTVTGLAIAGLAAVIFRGELPSAIARRAPLLFYSAATLLMLWLAMGPGGAPDGPPSPLRPYAWLMWLPGFESLRVPARFAMLGTLTLAVAAAMASVRLMPERQPWRVAFGVAVLVGLSLDGLTDAVPVVPPPPRVMLPGPADAIVIELPTDDVEVSAAAMYRQISHGRPVVNGYTGHVAPHYAVLSFALARGDTSVLTSIARHQPLVIVVNSRSDPGGDFGRMVEQIPGILRESVSAAGPVFLLPRHTSAHVSTIGTPLSPRAISLAGQHLHLDLGELRRVEAIEFDMRGRFRDLGERMRIEESEDGTRWREIWLGWTGEYALEATLRDPRLVPVRIPVTPVRTRYLRIYPAPPWLREDLRVFGTN